MNSMTDKSVTKKVFWILLITLIGTVFATDLLADNLKLIKEKSFQVKPGENLLVDASGADIKIESWNKDEVYVKIFGNRKAEEKMDFKIERTSDGVEVYAKRESSWFFNWGGGYSVRIEVYMPASYNNNIETSGGDIFIQNVQGKFRLDTSGGDIDLKSTSGDLKARTSGGDITLKSHNGYADVSTSGGDIKTYGHQGDLLSSTSGGDIHIEAGNGKISAKTSGGDIEIKYDGSNKGIYASTSGGDIKLALPANLKASVDFATSGGDIDCNFNNYKTTKVSRGKLKGEFNDGGESIVCKTTGGDIVVSDK